MSRATIRQAARLKAIEGFPGYAVSDHGDVYCCRCFGNSGKLNDEWRMMSPLVQESGHMSVGLSIKGKVTRRLVHRLVLEAFVGLRPAGMVCRHKDGKPHNNRLDNLCWGTYVENEADKRSHGRILTGSKNHQAKLNEGKVRRIRRLLDTGKSHVEIAAIFGVDASAVSKIKRQVSWRHV